ncbi:tripartite tricarboxylate transporter substrate binding protein [Xylophilus rhododendri]|uniref:Tripartite tricarboxylate transporter substrate binding protein n=1 Tax=Xylophilus rhododendri TaxID=2697032 RepID=A0A857IYZ5_9BURK|nr:tripartite tricarboxylate transporter substrate binding protein [Xylophilus rhododendri]QHI96676.1 tripartite tricarboxylate transporter substrate binding protein [Xylophilus rhododendri]
MNWKTGAIALGLAALGCMAQAQTSFPERPVTMIVPVPPGGILDTVARMVTPSMTQTLGQPVVIDNRAGAGGNIAASAVARAAPDGYTLLVGYSMFHVGNPSMYANLTWDPLRDFAPVGMLVVSPHVVAVNPATPFKTLRELVDYARANPGKLNYATSGTGSVPHVGMELFKQQNHIDIVHVPYKGAAPALQDVIAGNVQMTVATPPSLMGFVQAGKVRALAVAAKNRLPQMPDVPTTAEAGFPGFELEAWVALFAPRGTPPAVVERLTAAARTALASPQVKKSAETAGVEIRYMAPAELDAVVRHDVQYWSKVIKTANIRAE